MYNATRHGARRGRGAPTSVGLPTTAITTNMLRGEFGLNMTDQEIDRCIAVHEGEKGTGDAPHPFFS